MADTSERRVFCNTILLKYHGDRQPVQHGFYFRRYLRTHCTCVKKFQIIFQSKEQTGRFIICFKCVTAVDLEKRLKNIEFTISLYSCAPISELPSDISTMVLRIPEELK